MTRPTFTRVSELTPAGRGAVAVIAVEGDPAPIDHWFRARNGHPLLGQSLGRVSLGDWGTGQTEDVVVIRRNESLTEIHCHGGRAAVQRILSDLTRNGATLLPSDDWLRQSTESVAAECQRALTLATTERTAHHLLAQCTLFPRALQELPTLTRAEQQAKVAMMIGWSNFGLHLTQPWKVVLCGRPNVGKSSLVNALVGFARSVVFDQPGTTRDVVTVETAFDGWPIELSDTAGLREADSELEVAGIGRARERLSRADVVILVLDATSGLLAEDRELLKALPQAIPVWNKVDLAAPRADSAPLPAALRVSAAKGIGLDLLMQRVVEAIVPSVPSLGTPLPVTLQQIERLQLMLERPMNPLHPSEN